MQKFNTHNKTCQRGKEFILQLQQVEQRKERAAQHRCRI